jgi:hypothetical protein
MVPVDRRRSVLRQMRASPPRITIPTNPEKTRKRTLSLAQDTNPSPNCQVPPPYASPSSPTRRGHVCYPLFRTAIYHLFAKRSFLFSLASPSSPIWRRNARRPLPRNSQKGLEEREGLTPCERCLASLRGWRWKWPRFGAGDYRNVEHQQARHRKRHAQAAAVEFQATSQDRSLFTSPARHGTPLYIVFTLSCHIIHLSHTMPPHSPVYIGL